VIAFALRVWFAGGDTGPLNRCGSGAASVRRRKRHRPRRDGNLQDRKLGDVEQQLLASGGKVHGQRHLPAGQLGQSVEVAYSPKERQDDVPRILRRKRRPEDVTEDSSSKGIPPIDSTEAARSTNQIVNPRL
jgi:hypothetical protein